MLDVRATTIIYQAQVYYTNLINSLVATRSLGKQREDDWRKADLILGYLQTWQYEVNLQSDQDTTNYNYILYALIQLCGIVSFPVGSPLSLQAPTYLLQGPQGNSVTGPIGPRGYTGLATDFNVGPSSTSILVDSFLVTDAKAARWDYLIIGTAFASRAGSVIGHWTPTGSATESADTADNDLISTTDGIEFDVQYSGGSIYLIAIITSGNWSISGSRYFIPNNGNGTGPISGLLPNGQVYIGNSSNVAQAQILSGAFTTTNAGVTTLANNIVFDVNVSASAAIAVSKLAPLTASSLVVTNASGQLTTIASPTPTNIAFFDVGSSLTALLANKLTDPTTTVGDLIYRNGSNIVSRLGIGSANQVLTTIGGLPVWQTPVAGFSDPMTSIGDVMIRNGGNVTSRLGIGSSGQVLTVSAGVPTWVTPTPSGVTSVATAQPAAGFTVSGGPITTTGTLTFALSDDLAGVEGLVTTGIVRRTAPNTWLAGGITTIAEGGTNLTTYTSGDLLYSSATNILSRLGVGSTGQVLTVSGGFPSWSSINGLVPFTNSGSPATITGYARGWYYFDMLTSNSIIFGGGNAIGTVVTLTRTTSSIGGSVPPDSSFSNTITSNASASLNYKGRYVTSVPTSVRNITFMMVASASGVDYWKCVGEDLNTGSVPANVATQTTGADLSGFGAGATSGSYSLNTVIASILPDPSFAPHIEVNFGFYSGNNNQTITYSLDRSINGGGSWTSIKTVKYLFTGINEPEYAGFTCTDTKDDVNTRLYRLSWTASTFFATPTQVDYSYTFILT